MRISDWSSDVCSSDLSDAGDAQPGDLVLVEKAGRPPRITGRVVERLGDPFEPRSFSLIAIHQKGIPDVFSDDTLDEAEQVARQPLGDDREDLRHLPIVAIDPPDARDHDDAVWAMPAHIGRAPVSTPVPNAHIVC